MQLYFVYAPEYGFKVWFRKMIGEKSLKWQYKPDDPRYVSIIDFEYYETEDLKFNDEDDDYEKDHPYSKNPYDPYPLYYFYVTHHKYDYDLSEEKLSKIPEKPDDDVGFIEIINLEDGRLLIEFEIFEEFMNQIKKDVLFEIKKIWNLEITDTDKLDDFEIISDVKEEKEEVLVVENKEKVKNLTTPKNLIIETEGELKSDINQPKINARGRKTLPDEEKLKALNAWDQTEKKIKYLEVYLEECFGSENGVLNVKPSTFHGWRSELRKKGKYKNP